MKYGIKLRIKIAGMVSSALEAYRFVLTGMECIDMRLSADGPTILRRKCLVGLGIMADLM